LHSLATSTSNSRNKVNKDMFSSVVQGVKRCPSVRISYGIQSPTNHIIFILRHLLYVILDMSVLTSIHARYWINLCLSMVASLANRDGSKTGARYLFDFNPKFFFNKIDIKCKSGGDSCK
jgi:hypothetical protein